MSAGHLREMVSYKRDALGQFRKLRSVVSTFYAPSPGRGVSTGHTPFFSSSHVFSPDGNFLPVWGLVMILAIVYQALMVPYAVAFNIEDVTATQAVDFLCALVYFLDILISCNTGFYKNGLLIVERKEIVVKYAKSWLVWDVISSFPYDWVLQSPLSSSSQASTRSPALIRVVKIGRLLRSMRLMRVAKMKTHLLRVQQKLIDTKVAFVLTALSLLAMLLGIAHWVACGFFYSAHLVDGTDNWLHFSKLQDADTSDMYIASLYWAITTLTTTGYGDLHPVNTSEKVYGIAIMLISAAVFSVIVGKIGATISMVDKDEARHKDFILDMTRYLRNARVPERVLFRALRYMDYVWETRKTRKRLDMRLLNHFSEPLKSEISEHIYRPILSGVPCFSHFDRIFTSQLARAIATQIFAQDDLIFPSGQTSSEMYFVDKGKVEVYHSESEHTFAILRVSRRQPGSHFGEVAFFTEKARCASARCLEFSELLVLKRESLLSLLTPESSYSYTLIRSLFLSQSYDQLGLSCYICLESTHLAFCCPLSRIIIDRGSIRKKWLNKRKYSAKLVGIKGKSEANFTRRLRSVDRMKRFSVANVRSQHGFERLPRANYKLTKKLSAFKREFEEDSGFVVLEEQREDLEYCPVSSCSPELPQISLPRLKTDNEADIDEAASSRCSEDIIIEEAEDKTTSELLRTFPRIDSHEGSHQLRESRSWTKPEA